MAGFVACGHGSCARPLLKTKHGVSVLLRNVLSSAMPPVPSPKPFVYCDMMTRMPKFESSPLDLTRDAGVLGGDIDVVLHEVLGDFEPVADDLFLLGVGEDVCVTVAVPAGS